MFERAFVLVPLNEIVPGRVVAGCNIEEASASSTIVASSVFRHFRQPKLARRQAGTFVAFACLGA